jgi:hypothetical protein
MSNDNKLEPSTNGDNGRLPDGRFAPGNPGGPGNPCAAAVAGWRAVLVEAVTPDDIRAVLAELVKQAKAGERWAVKELLDRCLGRATLPTEPDDADRQEVQLPEDFLETLDQDAAA